MRKAATPTEQVVYTLFGPEAIKKICNTCGEELLIKEFYCKPNDKTKVRSQCKSCWLKYNGRSNFANVAMFEVK